MICVMQDLEVSRAKTVRKGTYIKDLALFGGGLVKSLVDQPGALVVLNVGSNLANRLWIAIAIQVVILDLEVLAKGQQNALSLLEGCLILDTSLRIIVMMSLS